MGLRDQNNCKKIGISGPRIYHVTTLRSSPLETFSTLMRMLNVSSGEERGETDVFAS